MKKYPLYFILLLSFLISCQKENVVNSDALQKEIKFDFGLADTRVNGSFFEPGDAVSLYAVEYTNGVPNDFQIGGNWINNEKLTCSANNIWAATDKLYWGNSSYDFYAVYPYIETVQSLERHPFELLLDQTTEKFQENDFLYAKSTKLSQLDGTVKLQFQHLLSRCILNVKKGPDFKGDIPSDIKVNVYNTATEGLIDFKSGTIQKKPFSKKSTVQMRKVSSEQFEALLIPQHIEKSTPLFEVTMGGIAYLLEYSISLKPGYSHNINLIVNTSPDQEKIEISIDAKPEQWS